jgi:hypothetical protein
MCQPYTVIVDTDATKVDPLCVDVRKRMGGGGVAVESVIPDEGMRESTPCVLTHTNEGECGCDHRCRREGSRPRLR